MSVSLWCSMIKAVCSVFFSFFFLSFLNFFILWSLQLEHILAWGYEFRLSFFFFSHQIF